MEIHTIESINVNLRRIVLDERVLSKPVDFTLINSNFVFQKQIDWFLVVGDILYFFPILPCPRDHRN